MEDTEETTKPIKSDDEVRKEASKLISTCTSYYAKEYERVGEDLRYIGGDMWTKEMRKGRGQNRVEIKNNILRPYRDRLVNPLRLHPLGGNVTGSQPIVEPLKAKIRQIEQNSRADEVCNDAFEDAVGAGYGWIEIVTRLNKKGALEVAYNRPSDDPCSVMLDPASTCIDGSDAEYGIKLGNIAQTKAIREFGQREQYGSAFNGVSSCGADQFSDVTIYQKVEGGFSVVRFIGYEVVLNEILPISYIPLIPDYGTKYRRDDNLNFRAGIVKWGRDAQMLVNYYKSQEAERIGKAPKSQWLLNKEQKSANIEQWNNPNAHDSLVYDSVSADNGALIPPPQRLENTANTLDLQSPYQTAISDTGRVLGMPDAMFGIDPTLGRETEGTVLARQSSAEIGTAQYMDNHKKSVEHATRIIIELIPHVYVTPENITISTDEGDEQTVVVDWSDPQIDWDSLDVDIASGPAYASKRKEDADSLMEAIRINPQAAPMLMDIVLRQQDSTGAKAMAKRLKLMLPPQLQDNKGAEAPNPEALQALTAAQQTIQTQEQEINALREMISQANAALIASESKNKVTLVTKQIEAQTDLTIADKNNAVKLEEIASKERIAGLNAGTKIEEVKEKELAATNRHLMTTNQQAENDLRNTITGALQANTQSDQAISDELAGGIPLEHRGAIQGGLLSNV